MTVNVYIYNKSALNHTKLVKKLTVWSCPKYIRILNVKKNLYFTRNKYFIFNDQDVIQKNLSYGTNIILLTQKLRKWQHIIVFCQCRKKNCIALEYVLIIYGWHKDIIPQPSVS